MIAVSFGDGLGCMDRQYGSYSVVGRLDPDDAGNDDGLIITEIGRYVKVVRE
jgi:hypothetical protein